MDNVQVIKQRFGIIGNSVDLNRAIYVATQVAPTDLSVLITGESGVGKEIFPRIIHAYSARKHSSYIAINCGAIPEGTIDSELFGHEKGAFTGALSDRKGYFEVSDGGTIFLDEVGELPLQTQSRLLRILESGEFIRVGSSKIQKTNVRVIAATNVNIPQAVKNGKFREDLYYRLNTIPIMIPSLRERVDDIALLFRKFAVDFAEKYRMPAVKLTDAAVELLKLYTWPGNIRQLKNITEQVSIVEQERNVDELILQKYLPAIDTMLPMSINHKDGSDSNFASEREILYKILFDMKKEMNDLKSLVYGLIQGNEVRMTTDLSSEQLKTPSESTTTALVVRNNAQDFRYDSSGIANDDFMSSTEVLGDESLSLEEKERELITKALDKNVGKRKLAALELGISERTLYRKIKEYKIK